MRKSCVLVTGSRDENDQNRIQYGFRLAGSILRRELGIGPGESSGDLLMVHGDAKGADRACRDFLALNCGGGRDNVTIYAFPADWEKHGKGAGPIRNQKMVDYVVSIRDEYLPVCLAFPLEGSIGTWDCVKRAQKAGIVVVVCP